MKYDVSGWHHRAARYMVSGSAIGAAEKAANQNVRELLVSNNPTRKFMGQCKRKVNCYGQGHIVRPHPNEIMFLREWFAACVFFRVRGNRV